GDDELRLAAEEDDHARDGRLGEPGRRPEEPAWVRVPVPPAQRRGEGVSSRLRAARGRRRSRGRRDMKEPPLPSRGEGRGEGPSVRRMLCKARDATSQQRRWLG